MKIKIYGFIHFLSLVFLIGTVGALDCDNISLTQAIIQGLIGTIVLAASRYAMCKAYEDDERYIDEEDM